MFENKVRSLYPKLTLAETKIADYLLANLGKILKLSSFDLAKRADVGQSSVIRFSKKMGYNGFGNMMKDVINSSTKDDSLEINLNDPTTLMLDKVKKNYIRSIRAAYESIDPETLEISAVMLNNTQNVICFGSMATGGIAEYLSESLLELGKKSTFSDAVFRTKQYIRMSNSVNDAVVLISKSGETRETIEVANFANKYKIPIISITNLGNTSLEKISTVSIHFLYDDVRTRLTAYTQIGGLMFVIDSLILSLYKRNYYKYRENSKKYRKFTRSNVE